RPHPRRSHGRGSGLEDATDHRAIREHVVIVVVPLAGWARSRCALEDQLRGHLLNTPTRLAAHNPVSTAYNQFSVIRIWWGTASICRPTPAFRDPKASSSSELCHMFKKPDDLARAALELLKLA